MSIGGMVCIPIILEWVFLLVLRQRVTHSVCLFRGGVFLIVPHGINVNLREKNGPISVSLFIRTAQPYPSYDKSRLSFKDNSCCSLLVSKFFCIFAQIYVSCTYWYVRLGGVLASAKRPKTKSYQTCLGY